MNTYSTLSIIAAYIGLTILNFSTSPTAKQVATLMGLTAGSCIIIAIVRCVRLSVAAPVADADDRPSIPIPPEQGTESRRTTRRSTSVATSPAPSYGRSEISPISEPSGSKPLDGMSFALTGKMPVKRAKMECLIEHFGGKVHKRIRKDTDFLVMGESRKVSGKEAEADRWSINNLTVDDLAKMCGITYHDIRDRYFQIVPAEAFSDRFVSESTRQEVRQYRKAAGTQRTLLKEIMQMRPSIAFPHPMPVIVAVDEDMELATVHRLEFRESVGDYILLTLEGEAIYLDDLRDCSVSDVLRAVA